MAYMTTMLVEPWFDEESTVSCDTLKLASDDQWPTNPVQVLARSPPTYTLGGLTWVDHGPCGTSDPQNRPEGAWPTDRIWQKLKGF